MADEPAPPSRTRGLWADRDFLCLWVGQAVSETGSRISREGIPYTALLVLHATTVQMGWLAALGGATTLLFGLPAGVWVDRRRRPVLVAPDLGRLLLIASVPLAALAGVLGMAQLYVVSALAGLLTVFFNVAYQSHLPELVEPGQLLEANSKLTVSATAAEICGPALTGALVKLIGAPFALAFRRSGCSPRRCGGWAPERGWPPRHRYRAMVCAAATKRVIRCGLGSV